jgi:hypothetical protein
MNKESNLKEVLEVVQLSQGDGFKFDEIAIDKENQTIQANKSNLAIKALTVLGGLFAAQLFLAFIIMAAINNSTGLITFGIVLVLGAIWLNRAYDKLIIDTLSISAYIAGILLLSFGLGKLNVDKNTISIVLIIIAIISTGISQNYFLSFISVLILNGSLLFLIMNNKAYNIIHLYNALITLGLAYWFLNEAKLIIKNKRVSKLYDPVRTGLVFSLIFGLGFVGIKGVRDSLNIPSDYIWASSIITISITIYLISIILGIINVKEIRGKIIIYFASVLFLLLSAYSPAISGSLIIILLSFLVNYKTGFTVGIISLVYFVSQYYYDLNFTLLTKSIILFVSGIIFLLFYLSTFKKLGTNEKV